MTLFSFLGDAITESDDERIAKARRILELNIMASPEAMKWLQNSGWNPGGGDAVSALRNPTSRDATIYSAIQSFSETHDNVKAMMERFEEQGLNNGTTTHAYLINMGKGSIGNGKSNHQAVLLVDEGVSPPKITIAFRGTNMGQDWMTHVAAFFDYLCGKKVESYEKQADRFWQGAEGDISKILNEVSARTGAVPEVTLAGHSYGADAATRMVTRLAASLPELRGSINLVGYGAVPSFTKDEQKQVMAVLGGEGKARQYFSKDDMIRSIFTSNKCVGEERELNCRTGHNYKDSANMAAIMDAMAEPLAADPAKAEARARALVAAYRKDPDSVMRQVAEYTSSVVHHVPYAGGAVEQARA